MKHRQQQFCSILLLLGRRFSASYQLPLFVASAFTSSTSTTIHRRIYTCHSSSKSGNQNEQYFGQGNINSAAIERQDAYGRTISTDSNADEDCESADPLKATAAIGKGPINLDPLVVCGPSGVGKGTVIESLRNRFPPDVFGFSVSHTTRQPRPGEIHGQHYHFTTQEEIQKEIDQGLFVEHARVHGNYYGTSKKAIEDLQTEQKITILDIDMQGVISVKESGIAARYVFIAPPSMQELEDRLRGRGTETEEAIRKRLGNAAREIEYGYGDGNFDRWFVNTDVERTVDEMVEVLLEWYPQLKSIEGSSGKASKDGQEETTIQQEPQAEAPSNQPFDFSVESDKMLRFPSVRKGHDKLEAVDRSAGEQRDRADTSSARYSSDFVDLEEPDGPRSDTKLGKTNPIDKLEVTDRSPDEQHDRAESSGNAPSADGEKATNQQQPKAETLPEQPFDFLAESDMMIRFPSVRKEHRGHYTVDLEEPDGPRAYPKLGKTNPNIDLSDQCDDKDDTAD